MNMPKGVEPEFTEGPTDWLSKARAFAHAKVASEGWGDEDIDRIIKEERKAVQRPIR
jgi:hypothetical protein